MPRSLQLIGPLVAACVVSATPCVSAAEAAERAETADSLATPITMDARDELWPVELNVAIVEPNERDPLPARTMLVPDGQAMTFDNVVRTPSGERRFEFSITPHHHPGEVVELEWKLQVSEARYRLEPGVEGWRTYALHRIGLGPRPALGPRVLRVVRADIVTSKGDRIEQRVQLGHESYEIRLSARRGDG